MSDDKKGISGGDEEYPILQPINSANTTTNVERNQRKQQNQCNIYFLLFVLAAVISVVAFTAVVIIYVVGVRSFEQQYAIVVDAGSSSSKIQLFTWTGKVKKTAAVTQTGGVCRTEHGISDFGYNPDLSSEEIIRCMNNTTPINTFTTKIKSQTNLYLGATAGMRMLSHSDPNATEQIFESLRKGLADQGYNITEPRDQVRIITGKEEAINAWISVNYLSEKFGKFSGQQFVPHNTESDSTYGALDLGGASTQVTFVPDPKAIDDNSTDISMLSIFGQPYKVYGHSYLCYGKKQVEIRMLAAVLKKNNFSAVVKNPCGVREFSMNVTATEIFMAPCVYGRFAIETFGEEIIPPPNAPKVYQFIGTGENDVCNNTYVQPFFTTQSFISVPKVPIQGKFLAFSTFFYVISDLGLAPTTTRENLTKAVIDFCSTRESLHPRHVKFDQWYCYDGLYILGLLKSYGFEDQHWPSIEFIDKIHDTSVSWSLGFMIDQSGHIPGPELDDPIKSGNSIMSQSTFIILIIVSILIFVCAVLFLSVGCKKQNKSTRNRAPAREV